MTDWLVIWEVTQGVGFLFKPILEDLAKDAAKDYIKDFFKTSLGLSLIHISSPRDKRQSRMPSSA